MRLFKRKEDRDFLWRDEFSEPQPLKLIRRVSSGMRGPTIRFIFKAPPMNQGEIEELVGNFNGIGTKGINVKR
jgi:hypothetical protein